MFGVPQILQITAKRMTAISGKRRFSPLNTLHKSKNDDTTLADDWGSREVGEIESRMEFHAHER